MSDEMVERVAQEIDRLFHRNGMMMTLARQNDRLAVARAAIEAMREPTEAMKDAGHSATMPMMTWHRMIDAALKEPDR